LLDRDGNFIGFVAPHYTQVPDELFDELLPTLSGAETKVLLYLVRRTFGFKRESDSISLNQMVHGLKARDGRPLDGGVGLSKPTIVKALKSLADKNIIITKRDPQPDGSCGPNTYALNVIKGGKANLLPQENSVTPPRKDSLHPLVKPCNPQETVFNLTDEYTDDSTTPQSAIVASLLTSPQDIIIAMQELGITRSVAQKLLAEHDTTHITQMIELVIHKLSSGWRPKQSVAAWLVSAIREGWKPPSSFTTTAEELISQARKRWKTKIEAKHRQQQEDAEDTKTNRERHELLRRLGIDERTEAIWQQTQDILQERSQWAIALAEAYLVKADDELCVVVPYEFSRQRVEDIQDHIEAALSEVLGKPARIQVIHEPRMFEQQG